MIPVAGVACVAVAGMAVVVVACVAAVACVGVARCLRLIRLARVGERRLISSQHALRGGVSMVWGVILGVRPTLSVCLHFALSVPD